MAAFLHKEGIVINQNQVNKKSNEITAIKPLLDPLDIEGKIVTMDAIHTQVETARYVKGEKKADYVLIVKGNQGRAGGLTRFQPGLASPYPAIYTDRFSWGRIFIIRRV